MEGIPVLLTDFEDSKGFCTSLMEFLAEKKANPFVLIKDFENIHKIYRHFPLTVPVVLNVQQSFESTIDHITAIPTLACVFNFDGEEFENLHRQIFENVKSIDICRLGFDIRKLYPDILEAIYGGYTLIINLVHFPGTPSTRGNLSSGVTTAVVATSSSTVNSTQQLRFVLEKFFLRNVEEPNLCQEKLKEAERAHHRCTVSQATATTLANPFSGLFRRLFTRFNPCAANVTPILNLLPTNRPVKSRSEVRIGVRSQHCQDIRAAFRLIHDCACKNWIATSEENFKYTPELQQQFRQMCDEIERKGEEGRKGLLDKVHKDIERTKQWDHVLGPKTLENLRITKEKEVELKVDHFCKRKITEAREKIAEEIRQHRLRMKGRFYREILDEQMMELIRIKENYQKKLELKTGGGEVAFTFVQYCLRYS